MLHSLSCNTCNYAYTHHHNQSVYGMCCNVIVASVVSGTEFSVRPKHRPQSARSTSKDVVVRPNTETAAVVILQGIGFKAIIYCIYSHAHSATLNIGSCS